MAAHIHKCPKCSRYTMEAACPLCKSSTVLPKPPKFSLQDKHAALRRGEKKKEEGLLI